MAPVTGSQQEEDKATRETRRRFARSMDSKKALRNSQADPRGGGVRGEDRSDDGGDGHQRREHREGGERQRRDDDAYNSDEADPNLGSDDLSSSVALSITSLPTATIEYVPTTTISGSLLSTIDMLVTSTQYVEVISTISGSSQTGQGGVVTITSTSGGYASSTCSESGVQETLFAYEDGTPNPNVSFDDVDNGYGDDDGHGDDHGGHSSPGGLSPTAEHALISVGSIGGFIIVCFAVWVAWRMVKKSQRKADGIYGSTKPSPPNQILSSIQSLGRGGRGWQRSDDTPNGILGSPPGYEKAAPITQTREIYPTNDPRALPQLQTSFSPPNAISPYATPTAVNMQNPQTVSPMSQMSQPGALPQQLQANISPASNTNPFANPMTGSVGAAGPYLAMSPNSNVQYAGTMGTMQTTAMTETDRSLMAHPFYNQSELARQPSNAYDPARRQVYRASELSSLSSGFGDGDIIMPPPAAMQQQQQQQANTPAAGAARFTYQRDPPSGPGAGPGRKDSVANASEAGGEGNRDTVYTTTSEDLPQRYRTVSSWVNQQTGRVHRAAQRTDDDAPPVPAMPPAEERYTMMMDDEEPRRPDPDTVPALPGGAGAAGAASSVPAPVMARTAEEKEMNP